MGEIIGRNASAVDILADVRTTYDRATARGGAWGSAATSLQLVVTLVDEVESEYKTAVERVKKLRQELALRDEAADALLAAGYDDLYNVVGRPGEGSDLLFSLLYPGGSSAYTDAQVDVQPLLMRMLARLLEKGLHNGIPATKAQTMAAEIRGSATTLKTAVDALSGPAAEVTMLERMRGVLARAGQIQLSRLKKSWKGQGISEADIHLVIPDRPRPRKKKGEGEGEESDDGSSNGKGDNGEGAQGNGGPPSAGPN